MKSVNKYYLTITKIISIFIIASFIGWIYEICTMYILFKTYEDRGLLHLPLCPIYGFGILILLFIMKKVKNYKLFFIGSVLITTIIELSAAYLLEQITGSVPWTYEGWPLNFQNKISLISSLIFGALACFFKAIIIPFINKLLNCKIQILLVCSIYFLFIFCIIWELIWLLFADKSITANNSTIPNIIYNSSPNEVTISGLTFSISENEIDLSNHNILESKESLLNQINKFTNLKKITMCDCGYSNEDMEYLITNCSQIEFVWMLHPGIWQVRTDAIAFSTLSTENADYRMTNEDAKCLKYCKNLELLDIGHNAVTDLSFLEYMPELRVLILMGNRDTKNGGYIKDLSELKYCPKLVYLEIFQNSVSDLSFLSYLPNLKDFNMVYNYADDIKYLKNLPNIERLYIANNKFSDEDCEYLKKLYPNAQVEYKLRTPIDKGWREHPRYNALRNMIYNNCSDPLFY